MTGKQNLILIAIIVLVFIGIFVWPTLYRYSHITLQGRTYPVRVHRITGRTEILNPLVGHWTAIGIKSEKPKKPKSVPLPYEALSKIEGTARITSSFDFPPREFEANIYNGSNWTITDLIILIEVKDKKTGKKKLSRKYTLSGYVEPLSSSVFTTHLGFEPKKGESFTWQIIEAKGYKP